MRYDRFYCDTLVWVQPRFVSYLKHSVMAGPDLIKTLLYTLNNLLQQEKYKAVLAAVKGFRNGAVWVKTFINFARRFCYYLGTAVFHSSAVVFAVVANQIRNTLYDWK